jgi:hypothetical protein
MGLPVTETISAKMCYVKKDNTDIITLANSTGADLAQGDFAVIDGIHCGIAQADIDDTESGDFLVKEGILIETAELHTSLNTFATIGQSVFWDDTLGKFVDTTVEGRFIVGVLTKVKDSSGVIEFEKFRYAEEVPAA